jgi:hypothetical protein
MDLPGQDGPPILAACAVGASLAFLWALFRNPGLPVRRGLAWLALSGAGLWLGLKFGIGFMTGGMSREWWDTWQLARYLAFLHVRVEILLVFAVGLSGVLFALTTLHALGGARATGCGVLGFALLASLTAPNDLARLATPLSRGLVVDPAAEQGRISRDDLDLVAWMDGHLPREKGLVGLACVVGWPLDPKASDLLICPYGGAQAVLHYARHENWCFYMHELARPFGFFDYVERIRDDFDARWCLDQGIRYFYVSRNALAFNSGLSEAIRNGTLVPLRESGDSTLYQILPGPTSP